MTLHASNLAPLNRTLDQELAAILRGASLECLVCGEFVLHVRGALACPECRSILAEDIGAATAMPELARIAAV
jgi:Zn finger protein HypA/HybF involved in hydrogenase expression